MFPFVKQLNWAVGKYKSVIEDLWIYLADKWTDIDYRTAGVDSPKLYKKRPVRFEAWQLSKESVGKIIWWIEYNNSKAYKVDNGIMLRNSSSSDCLLVPWNYFLVNLPEGFECYTTEQFHLRYN